MISPKTYIYGRHAVKEAIQNAETAVEKVFVAPYFDDIEIKDLIKKKGISIAPLAPGKMPAGFDRDINATEAHQGIVALISVDKLLRPYKEFVEELQIGDDTALVLLGELQDVQNVGAVIRSAAAFGIAGVLVPEHNQAPINGTVVKVSAGMAFRVPLVTIGNVNNAVRDLKDRGFRVYGLDGEAKHTVTKEVFDLPSLFILGNEATGIREKTQELCDKLISIPISPRCESLNAAASTAVALYAWSAQHSKAL